MIARYFFLAALMIVSHQAYAIEILTQFDQSPKSLQCDQHFGNFPINLRPCYVPEAGAPGVSPANWGPAHGDTAFSISITGPAVIYAEYRQNAFLNTPFAVARNPNPSVQTSAAYANGVGLNRTDSPCGLTGEAALDSPIAMGFSFSANCVAEVGAGQSITLYAIEAARDGVAVFTGPTEGVLMVWVYR